MRIDRLAVHNFKGFTDREFTLNPQFNLVVGVNGTGKTSVLDALAVAAGSWFLGLRAHDSRNIRTDEVNLGVREYQSEVRFEPQYPVSVEAQGMVMGEEITWKRALNSEAGRTTYVNATSIKRLAARADAMARSGGDQVLPLISYYGTGRLWLEPREATRVETEAKVVERDGLSRLGGYQNSVDPRLSVRELVRWIARQSWISYQQGQDSPAFLAAQHAMVSCVEGAEHLYFDAKRGEVIVRMKEYGTQPFANLSDGQRCLLAMVGDMAQKAAKLNPQLGGQVLVETPGVVLVDELDLHLHPRWQRRIIEDLRDTFPQLQFICTTHSPFLIQSLRSGEELIMLDGEPPAQVADKPIGEIAQGIQGISHPEVSERYERMRGVAHHYLETLEEAAQAPEDRLAAYKERLAESIAPYADNPAFQAFLEMKRARKLGE